MLDSGSKLAQMKLKILYIFKALNVPINDMDLTKFILENNYMDYFTLQELLRELKSDCFIDIDLVQNEESYTLTDIGAESVDMFINKIPQSFKDEINLSFKSLRKAVEKKRELFAHYYQRKDKDYTVILQAFEETVTVFSLSVNVPTASLAKKIVDKWEQHPEKIYSEIINVIMR